MASTSTRFPRLLYRQDIHLLIEADKTHATQHLGRGSRADRVYPEYNHSIRLMAHEQLPAAELFKRCAGPRDPEAWAEFHRRYHRTIAGVVIRTFAPARLQASDEVDDLVHDVYLRLNANNGRALLAFTPVGPASEFAYLKVIARNVVLDRLTQRCREPVSEDDVRTAQDFPEVLPSEERLERNVLISRIEDLVRARATDRDRQVFWLYYRVGLTAAQISQFGSIGLSVSGVESVITRLTRMIRGKLGEQTAAEKR